MSHITRIKTQIRDLEALKEALLAEPELRSSLEIGDVTVADYYGHKERCQARVRIGDYWVGFRQTESGTYQMLGDFWGVYQTCRLPILRGTMESIAGLEFGNTNLSVDQAQHVGSAAVLKVIGQKYGVAATKRWAAQNHYWLMEQRQDEEVRLRLRRYRNEEILVVIDADGGISVEVTGVKGKTCTDLTAELEAALGQVEKRQFKPEYFQETATRQKIGRSHNRDGTN